MSPADPSDLVEINFDGIVGPTHNYAGLSPGNLAATRNAGAPSFPRAAALQGIAKMRAVLALGLRQGVLLPHPRPDRRWLAALGTDPARTLFVAGSPADIPGASAVGMPVFWHNRAGLAFVTDAARPFLIADTLHPLQELA